MFNYQTSFDDLNNQEEIHPVLSENATLELIHESEAELFHTNNPNEHFSALIRQKIKREYPFKFAIFTIVSVVSLNVMTICLERSQTNNFDFHNDFTVISYRSLDGVVLAAACINIIFCLLNLISGKFKVVTNYGLRTF